MNFWRYGHGECESVVLGHAGRLGRTKLTVAGMTFMRDRIVVLIAFVTCALLLWQLSPILTPFAIGAGLAYMCDPIVDRFEALGLRRTVGVAIVFLCVAIVLTVLLLVLVPILQHQIVDLVRDLPAYIDWIQDNISPLLGGIAGDGKLLDPASLQDLVSKNWSSAGGVVSVVLKQAFSSGSALLALGMNLLLVPVIMFYLLRDWDHMVAWIRSQMPRRHVATIDELAFETNSVLGQFLRGQLSVMTVLGLIYIVGLWLMGLKLALAIGVIAGVVSFVPYLGVIVGLSLSSIAALVQTGDAFQLLWVAVIFGIGQIMEQVVLQPLLVGDAIGLHPVWVIFAVLAGGQLFGFIGVLLALPAAAAAAVLVRHGGRLWRNSGLYLDES